MRVRRKSIGGISETSADVHTATTPAIARAAPASIEMMRPCAWPERTTRMCSMWGKAISAAKALRPVTNGRSSRRLTERPMTLMSGPYLGVSPFARYCQPLKPGEIYEVDLEIWSVGLALPKGSRRTLTIQGKDFERPGATGPLRGVAWFTPRRLDRSSARIVCRHEHASYRRAVSILSFAAHVAHAIDNRAFECASRSD